MKHERRFRGHYVLVKDGRKVQEERHWAGYKLIDELVAHRQVKAHRRAISLTVVFFQTKSFGYQMI